MNPAPKLMMTAAMDVPPSLMPADGQIGDPSGLGHLLSGGMSGPEESVPEVRTALARVTAMVFIRRGGAA